MYTNRHLRLWLFSAALLAVVACGGAPERREAIQNPNFPDRDIDDLYKERFALESFQDRLDATKVHFDAGNHYLFRASRDSLESDVSVYIRRHPKHAENPEFMEILRQLAVLDTLKAPGHDFVGPPSSVSPDDSLALSFAEWPEIDIELDDGRLFDKHNVDFPELTNRRIDFWIDYFTGPGKARFERSLVRMQRYRPIVEEILDEMGLPRELICIALIESGFSMNAVSRAAAVGPWQFIRGTGKLYGLRQSWWYDERRDIVASTYAAGNYLKDLHGIWNDWFLAFAAYNCGEYRVARAIARRRTENFWRLKLPKQTERYVPKFLATLYILREPEKYGIEIPDGEPLEFDTITVSDATDLNIIAECAGVEPELVKELNPACRRWATPPKMEVSIKLPKGTGEKAETALAEIPAEKRITWRRHRVKRGETLSVIARKYGTTISALKRLNGIRNSHRIREGWQLIVPLHGDHARVASNSSKPNYKTASRTIDRSRLERAAQASAPPKGYKKIIYTVKDKDTLGHIAEAYNTHARKLRRWNDLSYRSYIYPGQKLAIYVPQSFKESGVVVANNSTASTPDESSHTRTQHVVRKGESFYSISRQYGVRLSDLLRWNNKSSRSIIRPGDVLQVWTKK